MRSPPLALLLLVCLGLPAFAQRQPTLPSDGDRPSLSLFLGNDAASVALADAFRSRPELLELSSRVARHDWTPDDPLYRSRLAGIIPPERFPAVMLQDRDGGVVYLASGPNVPEASELWQSMAVVWRAYKAAREEERTQSPADCPDGRCPVPNVPPTVTPPVYPSDPLGGRLVPRLFDTVADRAVGGPVRDALSTGVWLLVLGVLAAFLLLIAFAILAVVLYLVLSRRPPR